MTDNVLTLDDDQEQGTPAEDTVENQIESYLAKLVGEGKKFPNEEALAKGKAESDQFISHLQEESKGMRDTIKELEEQVRQLTTKNELDSLRSQLAQKPSAEEPKEGTPSPSVKPEELASMIDKHITERETRASAKSNVDQTNQALIKAYGDPVKAQEAIQSKAEVLGLSIKDITAMAAKSPTAVLALITGNQSAPARADIRKSSSVQAIGETELSPAETKAEFDKLRRENWHEYWSPRVQNRIFQLKKEGKYL